jgi:hypothetical protein
MIGCISGEDGHMEDTYSTLQYAQMAAKIQLKTLQKNSVVTNVHVANY